MSRSPRATDVIALLLFILMFIWIGWPGIVAMFIGCVVTAYHAHGLLTGR